MCTPVLSARIHFCCGMSLHDLDNYTVIFERGSPQVQRAFQSWDTGSNTGVPMWAGEPMKILIANTWKNSISRYMRKLSEFDGIISAAMVVAESGQGKKRGTHHKYAPTDKNEAVVLFQDTDDELDNSKW